MRRAASPYQRLLAEPRRYGFDAAVRVLMRAARDADVAEVTRFRSPPSLAYPPGEVLEVQPPHDGLPPAVTVGMMGLTGTSSVLPRYYTEMLAQSLRGRSRAMHDFLDLLSHRLVALFARAGMKYRPHRAAEAASLARPARELEPRPAPELEPRPAPGAEAGRDPVAQALLAFTGYATPGLTPRMAAGPDALLQYSGFFATHPRSADRLAALTSDWLGRPVDVRQFAGAWLFLPPDQRTALPRGRRAGAWNRLGVDAAIGVRAWDLQARIILRVGPLDRAAFEALLPDRPGLRRLVALVRAFLGHETGFAINPVLARAEVPRLRLDATANPAPRLGWNTWIPGPATTVARITADAGDALFAAEVVEAQAGLQGAAA